MSNRYRLIKEYPGSPSLGTIKDSEKYIPAMEHMKDYPEFWEEVVEKDYEILSLIEGKFIYPCDKYSKDYINQLFNTLGVSIHSVKRNDGEIFTIGDKCSPIGKYRDNIHSITKIWLCNPGYLRLSSNNYTLGIKDIQKVKTPLFTTEDGVDIFEGDNLYSIDNMLNIKKHLLFNARYDDNTLLNNRIFFNSDYKHFSTKEKAEEYILMNKPVLSLKEIKETTTIKGLSLKKLEKLVQQKLKS